MMQNILELDVASYATAVGHAAAVRLAQVLGPQFDANYWFCDPGYADHVDAENVVAVLGNYVVERVGRSGDVVAEQLFIKAAELEFHRHPANRFADLDLWGRVAYACFASVAALCVRELGRAQFEARFEETKLRSAVMPEKTVQDVLTEAVNSGVAVVRVQADGIGEVTMTLQDAADVFDVTDETKLPDTVAPVDGDAAGSNPPPDAEPAPAVEGDDASSSTASVASPKKHKR
jgi:hypothetical protein